jgi:hypothetical protein
MSALVAFVGLLDISENYQSFALASVHLKTPKILVMQIARYSQIL